MFKGGFGESIDGANLQLEYIEMDPSGRYGRVSSQINYVLFIALKFWWMIVFGNLSSS